MSYSFWRTVIALLVLVVASRVAAAQAEGLGVLSIPERQPIVCATVQPTNAALLNGRVVNRRFKIGRLEHIGGHPATPIVAPREVELMTDATGSVFLLDRTHREAGGDVVSVLVAPQGRPGLWRTITLDREKIRERIARGEFKPPRTGEGTVASRALTATEQAKADTLAQWLLKRGCSP